MQSNVPRWPISVTGAAKLDWLMITSFYSCHGVLVSRGHDLFPKPESLPWESAGLLQLPRLARSRCR